MSTDNVISELERLANLKQQGILTQEEFEQQKRRLLHSNEQPQNITSATSKIHSTKNNNYTYPLQTFDKSFSKLLKNKHFLIFLEWFLFIGLLILSICFALNLKILLFIGMILLTIAFYPLLDKYVIKKFSDRIYSITKVILIVGGIVIIIINSSIKKDYQYQIDTTKSNDKTTSIANSSNNSNEKIKTAINETKNAISNNKPLDKINDHISFIASLSGTNVPTEFQEDLNKTYNDLASYINESLNQTVKTFEKDRNSLDYEYFKYINTLFDKYNNLFKSNSNYDSINLNINKINKYFEIELSKIKIDKVIKLDNLTMKIDSVKRERKWISDRCSQYYSTYYRYIEADKNNKYLVVDFTIISKDNDPQLLPIYTFEYNKEEKKLTFNGMLTVKFYKWSDYGAYLGSEYDMENDFRKRDTIKFTGGNEIPDKLTNNLIVAVGKQGCLARKEREGLERFNQSSVYYYPTSCKNTKNYDNIINFNNDYTVIDILK